MKRPVHTILTLVACLLAAFAALVSYCALAAVSSDGVGKLGAAALSYPLHLLAISALAVALVVLARRHGTRLAKAAFGLAALLTAITALAPSVALWRLARQLGEPLSLGSYWANAGHGNQGPPQPDRSVTYGFAADGTELFLDVWLSGRPNSGPLRPGIVIVHGGAWTQGSRSMMPDWNRWLNELGYEVFDVEYRLPPPVRWRDEVGDVKSAVGWVAGHAGQYHVDPGRISVMGNSAGGNLAMLAAYSAGDPRLPPSSDVPPVLIRSVINLYGPSDMARLYRTSESPGLVQPRMLQYIGGTPDELPERYRLLSPIGHVSARAPPTITLLGKSDRIVPVEQGTLLDQMLTQVGVRHETYLLPASDHGFDFNWGGFATQLARARIRAFLEKYA